MRCAGERALLRDPLGKLDGLAVKFVRAALFSTRYRAKASRSATGPCCLFHADATSVRAESPGAAHGGKFGFAMLAVSQVIHEEP